MSATALLGGIPTLKYFDLQPFGGLAGRGGALRFYLLASGVEVKDEKFDYNSWSELKEDFISSGESPAGYLPVLILNGKTYTEHHATARYLGKKLGSYGKDDERDYAVDKLSDASVTWRSDWVAALGDSSNTVFIEKQLPYHAQLFETLIKQHGGEGAHVVGNELSFADAFVFGLCWDAFGTHKEAAAQVLGGCPRLLTFFNSFRQLPGVKEWCDEARPAP